MGLCKATQSRAVLWNLVRQNVQQAVSCCWSTVHEGVQSMHILNSSESWMSSETFPCMTSRNGLGLTTNAKSEQSRRPTQNSHGMTHRHMLTRAAVC